ncbi:MAG: hypothetical protein KatS3mg061_0189 [Dehalococcoidia bacterium]|nr:MAG: hypothetical protein KatS3mg061_0189 [Dehalococcoidia bacterium]
MVAPGIPPEQVPHLFTPFARIHDPQARPDGRRAGLGLGLAIARGIIEAHGGQIWAESQLGSGTCFHFTLPAAVPPRRPRSSRRRRR